jgi:hypothetical protein
VVVEADEIAGVTSMRSTLTAQMSQAETCASQLSSVGGVEFAEPETRDQRLGVGPAVAAAPAAAGLAGML